jgi:hypothetical protein
MLEWECDSVCVAVEQVHSVRTTANKNWVYINLSPLYIASSNRANEFCFLSSLPFSPTATTAAFGSCTCHLSTLKYCNTVSPVRACLITWWERFRETQKEDDRGPLSIHYSLGITEQIWPIILVYTKCY